MKITSSNTLKLDLEFLELSNFLVEWSCSITVKYLYIMILKIKININAIKS